MCWVGVCGGPGDGVDREPGRDRNGPGRCPGEGHDVAVEMGLVGVAGFRGYQGGAVTGGEAAAPRLTAGVLDQQRLVAEVDDQRDRRVRASGGGAGATFVQDAAPG